MAGAPQYVVCDQAKSILAAIRKVWPPPQTEVILCVFHLRKYIDEHLAKDLASPRLIHLSHHCFEDLAHWTTFENALVQAQASNTLRWLHSRPMRGWPRTRLQQIRFQVSIPQPPHGSWPTTTGPLESRLDWVKKELRRRRHSFRNRFRTDRMLALMQSQPNRTANVRAYDSRIRRYCQTRPRMVPMVGIRFGFAADRRIIIDHVGLGGQGSLR
jgi:hypothetical protein